MSLMSLFDFNVYECKFYYPRRAAHWSFAQYMWLGIHRITEISQYSMYSLFFIYSTLFESLIFNLSTGPVSYSPFSKTCHISHPFPFLPISSAHTQRDKICLTSTTSSYHIIVRSLTYLPPKKLTSQKSTRLAVSLSLSLFLSIALLK
jgi:hypothetical protein